MNINDRFIGDIRLTRVEEISGPILDIQAWYLDFNREELTPHLNWLVPDFYQPSTNRIMSSIHSWIVRTPRSTILIDTCTGNHKARPGWDVFNMLETPYLERLLAIGVRPEDVDVVLCTHLHVDHVGWNTQLQDGRWVPTFPNARYMMSRLDLMILDEEIRMASADGITKNLYKDSVLPVVEAKRAVLVEGTEEIDFGVRLVQTPGHTPGHMRVDLASGGQRATLCGDVLHHPLQVPLWRWRTRVCSDHDQARDTRGKLLAHCAEHDVMLLPAHFTEPFGGHVKAVKDSFHLSLDRMYVP